MAKVVILGASGMLGSEISRAAAGVHSVVSLVRRAVFAPVVARFARVDRGRVVIEEFAAEAWIDTAARIRELTPDVVINCIGVVKQSPSVSNRAETVFVNSMLPHLLAEEASREGFKLIHFSTDCVFSGEGGPYGEGDIPDPVDFYGRSKLLGEVEADQSLTIRSSIVGFSIDGTNRGLFDWFISNRGGVVTGYECALYSGVTTLEMSKIVLGIIENHREMSGIWQVSADPIDKASLLSLLNQEMDLGITIEKDDKFRCDRRLVSDRFRQRTGWRPPSWDVMVKELVERLKKSTSDLKG